MYKSENIWVNPEYIKHNISKLSIICDKNKYINSVIYVISKINIVKKHCIDIIHVDNNLKYYLLIADKGYITSKNIKINNKNVKRIFPKIINSKKKNIIIIIKINNI